MDLRLLLWREPSSLIWILSDVLMPAMDGYEFVRQLRNDRLISRMKVVFCTAVYHVEQARALAAACGVLHTISKPAEPETVLQTVNAALRRVPAYGIIPPTNCRPLPPGGRHDQESEALEKARLQRHFPSRRCL